MVTALIIALLIVAAAGVIVGLFLFGLSLIWTVAVYAVKVGFILLPVAVIYVLIRNIFIW